MDLMVGRDTEGREIVLPSSLVVATSLGPRTATSQSAITTPPEGHQTQMASHSCPRFSSRSLCVNPDDANSPDLPVIIPDCLEHVLRYLDTDDKGRSASVCRLWRDTCYRQSVWKGSVAKLSLSKSGDSVLHSVRARGVRKVRVRDHRSDLERITRVFESLNSLDIAGCYYTTDEALKRAFWGEMPELTHLDLSYCSVLTDAGVSSAIKRCPNLSALSLRGCRNVRLINEAKKALKRCKNLRSLNLAGCKQLSFLSIKGLFDCDGIQALPIKELNLKDCDNICDSSLQYIATSLSSSLKSLDLSFCISLTDEGIKAISHGLSHLEVLKLQSVDNITPCSFGYIASKCTVLKHLDIGFSDWVQDECLEQIARGKVAESLEQLHIKCTRVSDEGIHAVANSVHHLRCLVIGQCTRLTDACLEYVKTSLLGLVSIDYYGCCFSEAAIASLREALPGLTQASSNMLL